MSNFTFKICLIITILALIVFAWFCLAHADTIDMSIIAKIESNNNARAYNQHSGARGLYQITGICLKDYNQQNRAKIAPQSLFDVKVNERVAKWYLGARIPLFLRIRGIPVTVANVLFAYNAGIGRVVKGIMPRETKNYINRYYQLAKH